MTHSELEDIQLQQLLQEGNEEAFAEVYNRYWKLLYTTAYAVIQNEEVAKDAVQEVYIALWQRRNEAQIHNLKAYLQQAVRFQVLKAIRAQKNDEQFYIRLATVTADIIYENPLLFKEQEALLRETMTTLPDDCRQIFQLSREEQLTYKQIADQLNISEKTVEKKMSICLKHFRQILLQNKVLSVALLLFVSTRS
jgi:RNA polymerase sigma-70 factor (ECF subfamily)